MTFILHASHFRRVGNGSCVAINWYPNPVLEGRNCAGFSALPPRKVRAVLPGRTENLARLNPYRTGFGRPNLSAPQLYINMPSLRINVS